MHAILLKIKITISMQNVFQAKTGHENHMIVFTLAVNEIEMPKMLFNIILSFYSSILSVIFLQFHCMIATVFVSFICYVISFCNKWNICSLKMLK